MLGTPQPCRKGRRVLKHAKAKQHSTGLGCVQLAHCEQRVLNALPGDTTAQRSQLYHVISFELSNQDAPCLRGLCTPWKVAYL